MKNTYGKLFLIYTAAAKTSLFANKKCANFEFSMLLSKCNGFLKRVIAFLFAHSRENLPSHHLCNKAKCFLPIRSVSSIFKMVLSFTFQHWVWLEKKVIIFRQIAQKSTLKPQYSEQKGYDRLIYYIDVWVYFFVQFDEK